MKKKKWIYLAIILFITIPVLFLTVSFNGNPISKWRATITANAFLEETYPDGRYRIDAKGYNFKDSVYTVHYARFDNGQEWDYSLSIGPHLWPTKIDSVYLHFSSMDEPLSEQFSLEGTTYIKTLIQQVISDANVGYRIDIPMDVIDDKTWSPALPAEFPVTINITKPFHNESAEQFIDYAKSVQKILAQNEIHYTKMYMSSTIEEKINGVQYVERKFNIHFTPKDTLSVDDLLD